MARAPKPRWHQGNQLWVSDVGDPYTDKKGRPRRRTVSFPGIGRKETARAKKALDDYLAARSDRVAQGIDPTVITVCELYLEWLEANREPATFLAVSGLLRKFALWPDRGGVLGSRRVSACRAEDLEHVLADMSPRNAPSYCMVLHSAVQAAFNWGAKRIRGREPAVLLPRGNPFTGVAKPKIPRAPERYASRGELAAFLRWLWRHGAREGTRGRPSLEGRFNRQLCLLLRLLAHTGARPGELTIAGRAAREGHGFTWDLWHPDAYVNGLGQRVGLVVLAKHKTSGKTGRAREVVVPPILVRALERHRAHPWTHPLYVFTHRRGRGSGSSTAASGDPWTSASLGTKLLKLRRRAIAAGVPLKDEGANRFTAYRLRHSRATDLVQGGMSHDLAAALLGTSGRMVSTTYAHTTGSRLANLDDMARRVDAARKSGGK